MQDKNSLRPAKITWENIKAVFKAKMRKMSGTLLEPHIYEQIIWRRIQVKENSPICWYKGHCKVCGCDIVEKTMEDRACAISEHPDLMEKRPPCYPEMMDKKTWEDFKIKNKIRYFE